MKTFTVILLIIFTTLLPAKSIKIFYPDGTIKAVTTYKNDKKHGVEHIFYGDGATLKYSNNYINGKRHGIQQSYDKSAILIQEVNYNYGLLQGRSRFYQNGMLESEKDYTNGLLDGLSKTFFSSGLIKSEIMWHRGKATEGYIYSETGGKVSIGTDGLKRVESNNQPSTASK